MACNIKLKQIAYHSTTYNIQHGLVKSLLKLNIRLGLGSKKCILYGNFLIRENYVLSYFNFINGVWCMYMYISVHTHIYTHMKRMKSQTKISVEIWVGEILTILFLFLFVLIFPIACISLESKDKCVFPWQKFCHIVSLRGFHLVDSFIYPSLESQSSDSF